MPDINIVTQITDWNVGDILAGSAPGRSARIPGSTSADLKVLAQQGNGKNSAKPFWTSVGSIIPGLAAIATSGSANDLVSGTIPPLRFPALTGDVTTPGGSLATTISLNAVTNAKAAKMPPMTIKGNNSILSSDPKDLTVAEVNAMGIGGGGGGSGTVTSVSVVSANGLAGTVATATTTPAITLSTTITGLLKGNGTAISAAAAITDYVAPGSITTDGITMSTARLLGRTTAATGAVEEITVGTGLTLAAGALTATGGTGDFVGPASATDNAVVRFDTTTGKLGQNSLLIVADSGNTSVSGNDASGADFGFSATNINASGRAGFVCNNDLADAGGFSTYGSTFGVVGFRRATILYGGQKLNLVSSGAVSTGGTSPIEFYTSGYSSTPVMILNSAGALQLNAYGAGTLRTDASGNVTASTTIGTGDFVGPSSATDNAVVRFDGTTGKLGQNSVVTIDDNGNTVIGTSTPAGIGLTFQSSAYGFMQFKRSGSAVASWGAAGGSNDFITGSVVDDLCVRNDASKSLLFSTDNGGGIAMKLGAGTGGAIEFPQLTLTTGLSITTATKTFPLTINGTVVNVLCQ